MPGRGAIGAPVASCAKVREAEIPHKIVASTYRYAGRFVMVDSNFTVDDSIFMTGKDMSELARGKARNSVVYPFVHGCGCP